MVEPIAMQTGARNTSNVEEEKKDIRAEDRVPPPDVLFRLNVVYRQNLDLCQVAEAEEEADSWAN